MDKTAGRRHTAPELEAIMVNLDDYLDDDAGAQDFDALKDALKALADAIASTNLAVINAAQGDPAAATQRVQASVGALKRFQEAYAILDEAPDEEEEAEEDEEEN